MTHEEIKDIQDQFNKVISNTQCIEHPKTDSLFDRWFKAKYKFIHAMHDQLIYEYPDKVSFSLGPEEREARLREFIFSIESRWLNNDLANFIECNSNTFFNNTVGNDYLYNGIVIQKGMKLIKAFKFFELDKTTLTDIQNAASRIIQEDKLEGKLCLSVHPLDFLSLSENTYNWRSCHALDGEYRAGNLSYMVDDSTIICYLKGDHENVPLPGFMTPSVKWNSKKWRVLIFLSKEWDLMFAGRQYPFSVSSGLETISSLLLNKIIFNTDEWSNWSNTYLKVYDTYNVDGQIIQHAPLRKTYFYAFNDLFPLSEVIKDGVHSLQFNDLLHSTVYTPYYRYYDYQYCDIRYSNDILILVGKSVKCLECGDRVLDDPEHMMCYNCKDEQEDESNYYNCDSCGCIISDDSDMFIINNDILCQHCYESLIQECDVCGCQHYKSNLTWDRDRQIWCCVDCLNDKDTLSTDTKESE